MGIRDQEIQRLINYAKGMGVKVIMYSRTNADCDAAWALDGTEIEIFDKNSKSKTDIILDLIHELGHHLWFIHVKDRNIDRKFEKALEKIGKSETKNDREKIYNEEMAATEWWDKIYKEADIKIPYWKLKCSKEMDMWMWKYYYENNFFPKTRTIRSKRKEILYKWKPKAK